MLHPAGEGEECYGMESTQLCHLLPWPRGCLVSTVLSCSRRDGEDQSRCPGESSFQINKQHLRACRSKRWILNDPDGSPKGWR